MSNNEVDSVLESYASLMHAFDQLVGSCSNCLNNYSLQPTPENVAHLEDCLVARQARTTQVTNLCEDLYKSYEQCMINQPDQCVQPLAKLYSCARDTLKKT